jgi:hypothetical protein
MKPHEPKNRNKTMSKEGGKRRTIRKKKKNVVIISFVLTLDSSGSEHGMGQFLVIAFAKNSL